VKPVDLGDLARTTEAVFSLDELKKKLASGKPMRIKYGVDVTAPFLHIGHAVNLWMMRYLQERGHKVVFLIGDFTTRIGDPTGRSQARVVPTRDEIAANAEEFIRQVGQVLLTDAEVFEVRRNSEWFDAMGVDEFLSLVSMVTHSKLVQRDMFQRRIESGSEIYMHEMLYPLLQGYDSRMLESDLTIVGTDQLFNELMGRTYQEKFGQDPQVVMTTKITPGTDGVAKQSKTLGNYIALADSPRDKFGKIMSIPDDLIRSYYEVYTDAPLGELDLSDPYKAKKLLASRLVERYHDADVAGEERDWWDHTFAKRQTPTDMPELEVAGKRSLLELIEGATGRSRSEIRRLAKQNAIKLDEETVDLDRLQAEEGISGDVLKVGKRQWFRLIT
jgi:tyrosyl-tRNA synthetase